MKISICLLVVTCCCTALGQEAEPELMRLTRRPSYKDSQNEYRGSYTLKDPNNRHKSVSTVTVQLHLNDDQQNPSGVEENGHETSEEQINYQKREEYSQRAQNQENSKQQSKQQEENRGDTETGASSNQGSASYVLPPDSFMNQMRQNQMNFAGNQANLVQFVSTPSPVAQSSNQFQQYSFNSIPSVSNFQYFSTPSPIASTAPPKLQYVSSPANFVQNSGSQLQYFSTPSPLNQYRQNSPSQSLFNPQIHGSESNPQFVSTPAPRTQYISTPSPPPTALQFVSHVSPHQQSASQLQFVSTPSPIENFGSTPLPQHYVSTPTHYVSTPAPIQVSSSNPFGFNFSNANSNKGMHIDHFDNGLTGIRNPKYNIQYTGNLFTTTTVAPVPSSLVTTQSPFSNSNEEQWRATISSNENLLNQIKAHQYASQQNANQQQLLQQHMNQQQAQQQNIQFLSNPNRGNNQQDSQNSLEAANNLVVNIVHPSQNYRSQRQQQQNKVTVQRDTSKDTEVSPIYSNGEYGWKLSPKKGGAQQNSIQEVPESSGLYTVSSSPTNYVHSQASESGPLEYRPYPDNPFLNHISFTSDAPLVKSGSVKSINFRPDDNSEQQQVNVGYSIGFGNQGSSNKEIANAESNVYTQKYPFFGEPQALTATSTAPNFSSDVIRGVSVTSVSKPQQSYFLKENPQDFVTNALKTNDKYRNIYENNNYAPNFITSAPYKMSQSKSNSDDNRNNGGSIMHTNVYQNSQKISSFNTNAPYLLSNYHSSEGRNDGGDLQKWTNVGPGVEIASSSHSPKPLNANFQDVATANPVLYFNNPGSDFVTNTPVFFSTHKSASDSRSLQGFDHANALKNIQPIGLSNVVPYSPAPPGDAGNMATNSPSFVFSSSNVQPQQYSPSPNDHVVPQYFSSEQAQLSPGKSNSQSLFEQSINNFYNNYKPQEQQFYKDKNVAYNIQSTKPKQNVFESIDLNDPRTAAYFYGKSREQNAFESSGNFQNLRSDFVSPSGFLMNSTPDMIGHSSNIDTRQTSQMEYVPSETFRQNHRDSRNMFNQKTEGQSSPNRIQPDGKNTNNYHHFGNQQNSNEPHSLFQLSGNNQLRFENDMYEGNLNQNMANHNLEPEQSNSDNNFQFVSGNNVNKRQNNDIGRYDTQNDVDPSMGAPLTTIHGIKVANPYNVDLKAVSDILRGKPAVDESRLEPMREQMSRLSPIQLDTSALQEAASKGEISYFQMDNPNHETENQKERDFLSYDQPEPLREESDQEMNGFKNNGFKKNFDRELEYTESAASPFQNSYDDQSTQHKFQHNVPNVASEQLQNSLQSVLSVHQIGAVMDQQPGFKQMPRSQISNMGPEGQDFNRFSGFEASNPEMRENVFIRNQHSMSRHPNSLSLEEIPPKHSKSGVSEPYPLLKPPRMPINARASFHKIGEKRSYRLRHQRISNRSSRPSKKVAFQDEEDLDSYEFGVRTEMRPPPVIVLKKKSG